MSHLLAGPLFVDLPTSITLVQDEIDQAFTDTVSFTDGPIKTMGIVFGVVVLVLVGLKVLGGQMDAAIEQVLVDFEATLKRFYPQRWEVMEEELGDLVGDARDIKLLQMMEQLQDDEPEFMAKLKEKMADPARVE